MNVSVCVSPFILSNSLPLIHQSHAEKAGALFPDRNKWSLITSRRPCPTMTEHFHSPWAVRSQCPSSKSFQPTPNVDLKEHRLFLKSPWNKYGTFFSVYILHNFWVEYFPLLKCLKIVRCHSPCAVQGQKQTFWWNGRQMLPLLLRLSVPKSAWEQAASSVTPWKTKARGGQSLPEHRSMWWETQTWKKWRRRYIKQKRFGSV